MKKYSRVLTIAGSDSGGGAGIQADLKTFSALGCYGMSVVTALTAQNTQGVTAIHFPPVQFVSKQLEAVLSDVGADAIKVGMLGNIGLIEEVTRCLKKYGIKKIILDPVMVSKSGHSLLEMKAVCSLIENLISLCQVLTPNLPESEVILGRKIRSEREMEKAAVDLLGLGPEVIVLKGGHLKGAHSNDCICIRNNNKKIESYWLRSERIVTQNTHGTGCTLSSAIAAFLAQGLNPLNAIENAKDYLAKALEAGSHYHLGNGHGPIHHFYKFWS